MDTHQQPFCLFGREKAFRVFRIRFKWQIWKRIRREAVLEMLVVKCHALKLLRKVEGLTTFSQAENPGALESFVFVNPAILPLKLCSSSLYFLGGDFVLQFMFHIALPIHPSFKSWSKPNLPMPRFWFLATYMKAPALP